MSARAPATDPDLDPDLDPAPVSVHTPDYALPRSLHSEMGSGDCATHVSGLSCFPVLVYCI